jgi:hypothetical protein
MTPRNGAKSRRALNPASRTVAEKFSGGRLPAARYASHRAGDCYIATYAKPTTIAIMMPNQIMVWLMLSWVSVSVVMQSLPHRTNGDLGAGIPGPY